jgi:hypothetical protein
MHRESPPSPFPLWPWPTAINPAPWAERRLAVHAGLSIIVNAIVSVDNCTGCPALLRATSLPWRRRQLFVLRRLPEKYPPTKKVKSTSPFSCAIDAEGRKANAIAPLCASLREAPFHTVPLCLAPATEDNHHESIRMRSPRATLRWTLTRLVSRVRDSPLPASAKGGTAVLYIALVMVAFDNLR